jgi:DNA-binding NarL/FixJ family response regulator
MMMGAAGRHIRATPDHLVRASPDALETVPGDNGHDGAAMTTSVLIVDDHAGFRLQARRLLESAGYDVVAEAADGEAALALAALVHPDVVLLDVQLPDIDGFEVASRLAGCQVVLISGRDASTYRRRLAAAPDLRFIAKSALSRATMAAALQTP